VFRRVRIRESVSALILGLVPLSVTIDARAQDDDEESQEARDEEGDDAGGLRARLGPSDVLDELEANDDVLRLRAIKRLATMSDPLAIDRLIQSVRPDGAARTGALRLAAVRSLSRFSQDVSARRALVTVLSGAGLKPEAVDAPLEQLARKTAAMALAASRAPDAVMVLAKALRQGGPTSVAAAGALEAHPPAELDTLLATPGTASTHLVDVLKNLADQRAFHTLRSYVMRGSQELRAEAAVALTEMGHLETIPLAEQWLKAAAPATALRVAATRILSMAHTRSAPAHLARLFEDPELQGPALAMAFELPQPGTGKALVGAMDVLPTSDLPQAFAALGRVGDASAMKFLEKALLSPHAAHAAYALALSESDQATPILEQALSRQETRRLAARASVIRQFALGEATPGLEAVLETLLEGKEPADRAAGAWGLSALSSERARALLGASDPSVVMAAARNADSGEPAQVAALRLASEKNTELSLALSNALSDPRTHALVPTRKLRAMVQTGSVTACLAGRVLASRLSPRDEALVQGLLESTSREVRAETALGLGTARAPEAASLLEAAYEFEVDAVVRRAIVAAITQRLESRKARVLRLAERLDPDPLVRRMAAFGLAGHALGTVARGTGSFWLNLKRFGENASPEHALVLQGLRGHTRIAFPEPDGFVGLLGLDGGGVSYALAEPTG